MYLNACENLTGSTSGVVALVDLGFDTWSAIAPLQLEPE
jgi:hypothetical protein